MAQSVIIFVQEGFHRFSHCLPVGYRPRSCVKYLTVHPPPPGPYLTGFIINCGLKISKLDMSEWTKNNKLGSCQRQFLFGNFPRRAEEIFVYVK